MVNSCCNELFVRAASIIAFISFGLCPPLPLNRHINTWHLTSSGNFGERLTGPFSTGNKLISFLQMRLHIVDFIDNGFHRVQIFVVFWAHFVTWIVAKWIFRDHILDGIRILPKYILLVFNHEVVMIGILWCCLTMVFLCRHGRGWWWLGGEEWWHTIVDAVKDRLVFSDEEDKTPPSSILFSNWFVTICDAAWILHLL